MQSTDSKEQERARPPGTHSSEVSECRVPFRHGAIKLLRPDRDDAAAAGMKVGYRDCTGACSQGRVDDDFNEVFDFGRDDLGV